MNQILPWILFNFFIILFLIFDLVIIHKKDHEIKIAEALWWSLFWIVVALAFNVGIYFVSGKELAMQFLAGYILERSLSVDNLFVFLLIFSYFKVPVQYQYKVLFWGILGALVMRAVFILCGVSIIHRFHAVIYFFGAFLIFTGFKLLFANDKELNPEKNPVLKIFRKMMPVTENYEHDHFFIRRAGRLMATPLAIVLLVVETTDVVFAIDSIPAVLSISRDPFIVYTSNIMAILGLRVLYFALAGLMKMFHYLNFGLGVILAFVGVKMLLEDVVNIPIGIALAVIGIILALSIVASLIFPTKKEHQH